MAGAGVEFDYQAVAPAVFLFRARLDVADQRWRRLGPQHARPPAEVCRAHSPPYARLDQEVLHPVGAQAVLGHEIVAASPAGEPDLDLTRAPSFPAARREVEEFLLVVRRARHLPASSPTDYSV